MGAQGLGAQHPETPWETGLHPRTPHHHLPPCFPSRSRIACYVTIFQNISNLRDVFYKEMSKVGGQGSTPKHLSPRPPSSLVAIPGCSSYTGASHPPRVLAALCLI